MKPFFYLFSFSLAVTLLASMPLPRSLAFEIPKAEPPSLQLQAIQSRSFETTPKIAFASVMSVFQDLGYVIDAASFETGFITARRLSVKHEKSFWEAHRDFFQTQSTAFLEQTDPKTVRIRLTFSNMHQALEMNGLMRQVEQEVVQDNGTYQVAFNKIQQAIFIRSDK